MDELIEGEHEYENLWPKDNVLETFASSQYGHVNPHRSSLELKGNKRDIYIGVNKNEENEEQENDWIVSRGVPMKICKYDMCCINSPYSVDTLAYHSYLALT